jgi:RNA polymerase sigma factor (sigma-70 family)
MDAKLSKLRPWLLRRAQHLSPGRAEAEELVQDVLTKFVMKFKDGPALSEQASMAWLETALKNAFISDLRKQWARPRAEPDPELSDSAAYLHHRPTPNWVNAHARSRRQAWPAVVTFYSPEPDTDYSFVVTSVAAQLAQRDRRVLVIDFNLQTPQVEQALLGPHGSTRRRSMPDLVELLRSLVAQPMPWRRCTVSARPIANAPEVHVLSARPDESGQAPGAYDLDFDQMFEHHDFGRKLEALRSDWLASHDAVLINSPPGTNTISGICVINLADVVVAALTLDWRSIQATKSACRRATTEHAKLPVDRRKLLTIPLLLQSSAHRRDFPALQQAASELGEFFADWLPGDASPVEALRLHHRLASLLDSGWTEPVEGQELGPTAPEEGHAPLSATITNDELEAAMRTLSLKQRQVLEASAQGLRYAEIARELGIREGTVAKRVFDARKLLRAALLAMKSRRPTGR